MVSSMWGLSNGRFDQKQLLHIAVTYCGDLGARVLDALMAHGISLDECPACPLEEGEEPCLVCGGIGFDYRQDAILYDTLLEVTKKPGHGIRITGDQPHRKTDTVVVAYEVDGVPMFQTRADFSHTADAVFVVVLRHFGENELADQLQDRINAWFEGRRLMPPKEHAERTLDGAGWVKAGEDDWRPGPNARGLSTIDPETAKEIRRLIEPYVKSQGDGVAVDDSGRIWQARKR